MSGIEHRASKRIAIIGSPGAGKSTFARRLGDITSIEVYHLDRLYWKPGWVETPRPEWIEVQQRLVRRTSWIIDGNYGATMDTRIQAADTVIFLDFPRWLCLWRAYKRAIRYRGQTRPDMGADCPERINVEFTLYIWKFRKRQQNKILRRLDEARHAGKQVIRLTTRQQVETYLSSCAEENA